MKKSNVILHVIDDSFKSVYVEYCPDNIHFFQSFKAYQKYAEHRVNVKDVISYKSYDDLPNYIDENAIDVLSMI